MKRVYIATFIIGEIVVGSSAKAAPPERWVLSEAMAVGVTANLPNPVGPWAFMDDLTNTGKQINYKLLPNYNTTTPDFTEGGRVNVWNDSEDVIVEAGVPKISFNNGNGGFAFWSKGIPHFHPGQKGPVIVRWTSPISGYVNVYWSVRSTYPVCGDEIDFEVKKEDLSLEKFPVNKGFGWIASLDKVAVSKGTRLYFVISEGPTNSNFGCDHNEGDIIISTR